mgnify:CR=1 FL=1
MARQARAQERAGFEMATRMQLVERDLDSIESTMRELTHGQRRSQQILMGVLISVATGSILLAINVAVSVITK